MSTRSGEGTLGQTSPYKKMLSCDPRLDFLNVRTAPLPGSPLSLRFGRVIQAGHLRAFVSTRSEGSFGRGHARENEPVSKNAKL